MTAEAIAIGDGTRVRVEVDRGVAFVQLHRPEKMNALDLAMFDALIEAPAVLAARGDVRCVVMSGAGRGFCAGLDLAMFAPGGGAGGSPVERITEVAPGAITHRGQQAVFGWTELPMPVIAAVHGVALGGGIQLALGADIRCVSPEASLGVLEMRWGLVPDMTGTRRLIELVGLDVAKELTFTGRTVDGVEAGRLGLATFVVDDPLGAATALAREIAGRSPHAVRAAKRLFRARDLVEAEVFALERGEMDALIGSPNQVEAVAAALEGRPPVFSDPV
jgi:enoyl-CoA hydratase/carnithine racemase